MVRQELDMSCGAACARQLLLDVGIDVAEAVVRDLGRLDPVSGIDAQQIARVLSELHPGASYEGGSVGPEHIDLLLRRAPFLALLKVSSGKHWVIVDRMSEGLVWVRDPAGGADIRSDEGMEASMELQVFLDHWRRTFNGTVFRR